MYRNTPVMRAAVHAVWHELVGGSETAEAPNWYVYALRGRRELCVHDGALRVGVSDASESYGHARHARRVCYTDVTVSGSKQLRRPTSNFEEEFDQIWSSISGRSRHDLSRISDLGSISGRSRVDHSRISGQSRDNLGRAITSRLHTGRGRERSVAWRL